MKKLICFLLYLLLGYFIVQFLMSGFVTETDTETDTDIISVNSELLIDLPTEDFVGVKLETLEECEATSVFFCPSGGSYTIPAHHIQRSSSKISNSDISFNVHSYFEALDFCVNRFPYAESGTFYTARDGYYFLITDMVIDNHNSNNIDFTDYKVGLSIGKKVQKDTLNISNGILYISNNISPANPDAVNYRNTVLEKGGSLVCTVVFEIPNEYKDIYMDSYVLYLLDREDNIIFSYQVK